MILRTIAAGHGGSISCVSQRLYSAKASLAFMEQCCNRGCSGWCVYASPLFTRTPGDRRPGGIKLGRNVPASENRRKQRADHQCFCHIRKVVPPGVAVPIGSSRRRVLPRSPPAPGCWYRVDAKWDAETARASVQMFSAQPADYRAWEPGRRWLDGYAMVAQIYCAGQRHSINDHQHGHSAISRSRHS